MMIERHSHKKFRVAIVILAIVAIAFLVGTAWLLNELNETQNTLRLQLRDAEAKLATVESELSASKELIKSLEATLSNLRVNLARLTTGYGHVLRDPTYREMRDFLARDKTSEKRWVADEFTCVDFAARVKANAAKERLRVAFVLIEFPRGRGHAVVAFYTTDRGRVFIEPQFDWKVEPQIGKRYYRSVKAPAGRYMARPPFDDTITRIIVIW